MNHVLKTLMFSSSLVILGCDNDPTMEQANTSSEKQQAYAASEINQPDASSSAPSQVEPSKPEALQATVEFEQNSTILDDEAREELRELIGSFNEGEKQYLTIRMYDDDGLDVTDPEPDFKKLSSERTAVVTKYLAKQGANLASVYVDESGVVSEYGEGNPMARPESESEKAIAQYVTVTIKSD